VARSLIRKSLLELGIYTGNLYTFRSMRLNSDWFSLVPVLVDAMSCLQYPAVRSIVRGLSLALSCFYRRIV
jgi:hypothetical protein